jgi:hypothetical protein
MFPELLFVHSSTSAFKSSPILFRRKRCPAKRHRAPTKPSFTLVYAYTSRFRNSMAGQVERRDHQSAGIACCGAVSESRIMPSSSRLTSAFSFGRLERIPSNLDRWKTQGIVRIHDRDNDSTWVSLIPSKISIIQSRFPTNGRKLGSAPPFATLENRGMTSHSA